MMNKCKIKVIYKMKKCNTNVWLEGFNPSGSINFRETDGMQGL